MIRVVIRYEQALAKNRLSLTVWDRGKQVHSRVQQQESHFFEIALNLSNATIPSRIARRVFTSRPVAGRKFRRDMVWIPTELENIPLADAQVLEQLPSRVRASGGLNASKLPRPLGKNGTEVHVRVFPIQEASQVFAQSCLILHWLLSSSRSRRPFQLSCEQVRAKGDRTAAPPRATRKPNPV